MVEKRVNCLMFVFLTLVCVIYLVRRFCPEYLLAKTKWGGYDWTAAEAASAVRISQRPDRGQRNGTRIILYWNKLYGRQDFGFGLGRRPFIGSNCSESRCYASADRSLFDQSDAVVFHLFGRLISDRRYRLPARARPEQVYLMAVFESPLRLFYDVSRYRHQFNLTMSYLDHPDTDLRSPYGSVLPRDHPDPSRLPSRRAVRNKTGLVAWVVSNCKDVSMRSDYVRELRQHIRVDVYGKCGNLSCPLAGGLDAVYERYKFFLAFENSYCRDYVTEKLFRSLKHVIVPVVLGAADYDRLTPDGAVIDVRRYRSPRHLADYLKWLDHHEDAYLEYFSWKQHYEVTGSERHKAAAMCRLCEILHDKQYPYKRDFDPGRYWDGEKLCTRGDQLANILHIRGHSK